MASPITLSIETQRGVRRAVFLIFFFVGLAFSSWASRIPEIKRAMMLDDAQWGMMLFMIPLGQILGMSFSGWLISKVGSNKVLIVAVVGYAMALFGIGSAPSVALFVTSLIGFGFFGNFCNIAMNTQAVIAENHYSKPIMASFHGGWSLAGLFGGLFGLAMSVSGVSTNIHFLTIAVLIVIGALTQYRYLQYDAEPKSTKNDAEQGGKAVKYERFLFLFGIVGFFGWATEGTMADWNGIYLGEIVGVATEYTPIGLTIYMIAMTIGRFLMDKVTARIGRRAILCGCSVAIFIGMFIAVLLPYTVTTLIGYMIVGFGACGVIPTLYSAAGEQTKMHAGRALTLVSSISFAGFLVGPPLIGYISDFTNLRYAFALIGIFGLFSWFIAYKVKQLK